MRHRIWWEDIKDKLYHTDRLIGAIEVGWLKIVEEKKNFFVVEGDKETIEYVREKRTELQWAIDYFLKKVALANLKRKGGSKNGKENGY